MKALEAGRELGQAQAEPPRLDHDLRVDEPAVVLEVELFVRPTGHHLRLGVDVMRVEPGEEQGEDPVVDSPR